MNWDIDLNTIIGAITAAIIFWRAFGIEKRLDRLEDKMDDRFKAVDERFKSLDAKFDKVDMRFEKLEGKIDAEFKDIRKDISAISNAVAVHTGAFEASKMISASYFRLGDNPEKKAG